MMVHSRARILTLVGAVLACLLIVPSEASANTMFYFHGRSMKGWPGTALVIAGTGVTHVTFSYNGDKRLLDTGVRDEIKAKLNQYCTGTKPCYAVCYSAGCARLLQGLQDVPAARNGFKLGWIEAPASAAGGTEIANYTTKWWQHLLAKLFGKHADIDHDLRPSRMRSFSWQDLAPGPMYHSAGKKNFCTKIKLVFVSFKLCGNGRLPGGIGDGAVPPHSACGYAQAGTYSACDATGAKYDNRRVSSAALQNYDHMQMLGYGVIRATQRRGLSTNLVPVARPVVDSSLANCSITKDDCDAWSDTATSKDACELYGCTKTPSNNAEVDLCMDVDANGCAYCSEFSVAQAAYGTTCGGFKGIMTMASASSFKSFTGIDKINDTTLRFQEIDDRTDLTFLNGVKVVGVSTATRAGQPAPSWCSGSIPWVGSPRFEEVTLVSPTKLKFTFASGQRRCTVADGQYHYYYSTYTDETLTISGATFVNSKLAPDEGSKTVVFGGNRLIFTGKRKFLVLHPADRENEWVGDPLCASGLKSGSVCCWAGCGSCGGTGCSAKPGGSAACCGTAIQSANTSCSLRSAPCVMP